jgi:hypothetical protein
MRDTEKIKKTFAELDLMVHALHEVEPVGDPLHIIVDDGNVRDCDLVYCCRDLGPDPRATLVDTLCSSILHLLTLLTEPQRMIWWLHQDHRIVTGYHPITTDQIANLALRVRDGVLHETNKNPYSVRISSPDGKQILWEPMR